MSDELTSEQRQLFQTKDVCRRITLMLPLAHVLNDIPMRNPAERLLRVVALLEEAMRMTDGGAFEFRTLIQRFNVPGALSQQLAFRKAGSAVFAGALREDLGPVPGRRGGMGGDHV